MANTIINPPKMGNTSLPLAAIQQWAEADAENNPESWGYVSGLLSGILIYRPDISEELTFLVGIAAIRAGMATTSNTSDKYATLTPKQRLDALSDAVSRMKSHSVVLSQFFTRPTTKQAALEGMEAELANLQTLWALVRADLSEVQQ